ncbi:hypothetical protein CYMTET_6648 [Cymbomonas tetramitiformis]|uniref:Uncharacterized protein n=1 Tax=Cymbomonas tetramitiformis TaxID=36881 RepID=A0AAE0GWP2_9CHLO|nr:hypothetical protein CYMTET_6648 [Cymbomonas tetramitiformis]
MFQSDITGSTISTGHPASVIASNGTVLAFCAPPTHRLSLCSIASSRTTPILDLGNRHHERAVNAICLWEPEALEEHEFRESTLLCSASRDAILLWHVEEAYATAADGHAPAPIARLSEGQGNVEALTAPLILSRLESLEQTSPSSPTHAGDGVQILQVPSGECVARIEGHTALVTGAAFCLHAPHHLVTISEDRTYKVWDLEAGTVLHNSSILCAAALTCLALDPSFPRLAVGAADGVVRFFDLSTPAYRQVQVMDVGNAVEKQIAAKLSQQVAAAAGPKGTRVISCAPQWKSPAPPEGDLQAQAVSWGGCAVGSLFYATSLAAHQVGAQHVTVTLAYSADGSRLATASVDKTARAVRLPLSRFAGEGTDFIAHSSAVNCVSWSRDSQLVLTAGADRAAYLWSAGKADPALALTHVERPHDPNSSKPNAAFLSEVKAASFMYLDRFIVLASGGKVYLYRYLLNEDPTNDLKRLQNSNKYRLVQQFTSTSNTVTSLACSNGILSNLVLCAGSNRAVEALDLGEGRWVRAIEDAHSRPVHTLVLNSASPYVNHPQEAYELFATAAVDSDGGCVKLWDLRTRRCVHRFSGHANRQHSVGVAFSPCLRYLGVGSEDKVAHLFDMRMGIPLHRLKGGHTDVVSDIAFHPLYPQVATACFDGRVRFFSDVA